VACDHEANNYVPQNKSAEKESFIEDAWTVLKRGKLGSETVAPIKKNDLQRYFEDGLEETKNPLEWWKVVYFA